MNPDLVARARHGLRDGTLPVSDTTVCGTKSAGATCFVCNETISAGSTMIELERQPKNVPMHPECYMAWDYARKEP